jgi:hypothetical protein
MHAQKNARGYHRLHRIFMIFRIENVEGLICQDTPQTASRLAQQLAAIASGLNLFN